MQIESALVDLGFFWTGSDLFEWCQISDKTFL